MNVVARAGHMRVHNGGERGEQFAEQGHIAGGIEILANGLDIPERGVNRVVLGRLASGGKIVRKHSFTDEACTCPQDIASKPGASGGEAKPRKRDHGVASPIAEPWKSRQDRSRVRRALYRSCSYKLIRCECQLLNRRRRRDRFSGIRSVEAID